MRKKLRAGNLDERQVEIEIEQSSSTPMMQIFSNQGTEEMDLKDMLGNMMGGKNKSKRHECCRCPGHYPAAGSRPPA